MDYFGIGGVILRVEEVVTPSSKKRYLLVNNDGEPIEPV